MKCSECGKRMSWLYYLCPWTVNYKLSVESEDGSISEPKRVCPKCGAVFQELEKLVKEVGEEKALAILDEVFE